MLVRGTNRRALIAGLGSAVAAWPVLALGQQPDRSKRIGVLMDTDENDPFAQARLTKLRERLKELGWTEGQNFRLDIRWGSGSTANSCGLRQSWFHLHLMSLSLQPPQRWRHCNGRPPLYP